MKDLGTMTIIQGEKMKEILSLESPKPINAEVNTLAENKRFTFDIPVNAVTVDPLR